MSADETLSADEVAAILEDIDRILAEAAPAERAGIFAEETEILYDMQLDQAAHDIAVRGMDALRRKYGIESPTTRLH